MHSDTLTICNNYDTEMKYFSSSEDHSHIDAECLSRERTLVYTKYFEKCRAVFIYQIF